MNMQRLPTSVCWDDLIMARAQAGGNFCADWTIFNHMMFVLLVSAQILGENLSGGRLLAPLFSASGTTVCVGGCAADALGAERAGLHQHPSIGRQT
jgi:hypothetical protein